MAIDFSQFESDEFTGVATSRPHCQVMNDAGDQGLFISQEIADRVELKTEKLKPHVFKTKQGDKINGFLFQSPRLLIIHVGDLICTHPDTKPDGSKNPLAGQKTHWKNEYKGDREIKKTTKYLVFFLDSKNEFLHSEPIQLNAGGVFSTSFAKAYKSFKEQFQKQWTDLSKDRKPKNQGFFCHAVFAFNTTHELHGSGKDVNQCCIVKDFAAPTEANISDGTLFLGGDNIKRALIREVFVANEGYGTLAYELDRSNQSKQQETAPNNGSDNDGNDDDEF
jgi:hypothetical protein